MEEGKVRSSRRGQFNLHCRQCACHPTSLLPHTPDWRGEMKGTSDKQNQMVMVRGHEQEIDKIETEKGGGGVAVRKRRQGWLRGVCGVRACGWIDWKKWGSGRMEGKKDTGEKRVGEKKHGGKAPGCLQHRRKNRGGLGREEEGDEKNFE